MKKIGGGVCAPKGFQAGGIACGIKASSKKRDLALIYSEKPCAAAAVFTTNRVKAASVLVSREHVARGVLRAVIVNSGNANACTGEAGLAAARKMASLAAGRFNIDSRQVAVASTGVIGVPLPINVIERNIGALADSLRADETGHAAALEAIMTTDIRKKEGAVEIEIDGKSVRIGGMVKGSGMIHPNMATMLCFITSDAVIPANVLDGCLRQAVRRSFNRLTVDGDTSTNDSVIIMANGEAGNSPIAAESASCEIFAEALEALCVDLARATARDGEGATKLVTVTVSGAADEDAAATLARAVASSSLVKAACFGADANWGRVLCAMGYSGADFNPGEVDVVFASAGEEVQVCAAGASLFFSEEDAKRILRAEEIEIRINAGKGPGKATVWGCDLSYDYVKINGDYRS
ncbi:MAG: bifunctional glutamate N-acetyltransferase/amino-acid acetyltransferase ArgJ [Treponema sp.]|jgi:glutamate N-acetyltransferase/amino-acid N-acetyltransferase|nr:bifunctional glutamate N-acetyltransferase/amino-acid acetyltransferase ArgJ [Treponema sp.]